MTGANLIKNPKAFISIRVPLEIVPNGKFKFGSKNNDSKSNYSNSSGNNNDNSNEQKYNFNNDKIDNDKYNSNNNNKTFFDNNDDMND